MRPPGVIVVTGAGRGIGRAVCTELLQRGCVVVALVRSEDAAPVGCVEVVGDLRDASTPERLLAVARDCGPIDVWINNAGVLTPIERLDQAPLEEVIAALEVNLLAVVRCSALYAGHVAQRSGGGLLLNVSSGAASSVYEGWSHYAAAKAAVDQLTRVLAAEGEVTGLRALAVAPGVVDTDMQAQIRATPATSFPARGRFVDFFDDGELKEPATAAREIVDLAFGSGDGAVVRRL